MIGDILIIINLIVIGIKFFKRIYITGSNLSPYSVATGSEKYYLLAPNFSFIKKDKIDYDTILKGIYVPKSDFKESSKEIDLYKIHSNYDNDNDDDNEN